MPNVCPKGQILRKGYTTKRGSKTIRVPSSCIKARSQSGKKRSDADKLYIKKRKSLQREASSKFGKPKCKKGEIIREGYYRKAHSKNSGKTKIDSTWVAPTCVEDTGKEGKGEQLFVLEKGVLGKFGYEDVRSMSTTARQSSLRDALKKIKPLSLYRRLNALYVLNKDKNKNLAKIFKDDAEWIKTTRAYMNRDTAKRSSKKRSSKKRSSKKRSKR